MSRILLVEDDPNIAFGLEKDLQLEGYETELATDGEAGVRKAREWNPDLIILDVMLPKKDGYQVCRELRHHRVDVPIIMLTARSHEAEKVLGLELGADDYVTKPFSPLELRARVRAFLRRSQDQGTENTLAAGQLEVNLERFEVRRAGHLIEMTPIEFKLLVTFIKNQGKVLSRDQLLDLVWGSETAITDRVVDTHIANLRKKIEPDPAQPRHVISACGLGYRFEA